MKLVPLVSRLLAFSAVTAVAGTASAASQPTTTQAPLSVAIVVGSNQSPSSALENLRYGDDDAVRNARTMELLGAQTTLLVSPDAETRELYPMVHPASAATRGALRKAFDDAKATLAAAHKQGRKTELYFMFAGHGDKTDGRPFVQLDDGHLYREDLAELLRGAGADENHVIVDACYAASFVNERGPGGTRESLPPGFSQAQAATWPKRTGFLTARSSGGQTHEWAEYQSGVFSHELRSGLMGAADVNVDGKVTYREIAAFVRRANEAIPNRRYRPEVSTLPPGGDLDAALADLPAGPMVLEMDTPSTGRTYVETETGIRLADLHTAPGAVIKLRLPTDMGKMFIEQVDGTGSAPTREYRLAPEAGHIMLSALTPEPTPVRARGAGHEAFLHLFARPFDVAAVTAFQLDDVEAAQLRWNKDVQDAKDAQDRQTFRRKLALGAFGLSVGTAAVGAGLLVEAYHVKAPAMGDVKAANDRITRLNVSGGILLGVAGASAVTGALLYFWPSAPHVSVGAGPGCDACIAYQRSF